MKEKNKILSLLIVLFIVGVNSLTACGQNPKAKVIEPENSVVSEQMNVEAKDDSESKVRLERLVSDSGRSRIKNRRKKGKLKTSQ